MNQITLYMHLIIPTLDDSQDNRPGGWAVYLLPANQLEPSKLLQGASHAAHSLNDLLQVALQATCAELTLPHDITIYLPHANTIENLPRFSGQHQLHWLDLVDACAHNYAQHSAPAAKVFLAAKRQVRLAGQQSLQTQAEPG